MFARHLMFAVAAVSTALLFSPGNARADAIGDVVSVVPSARDERASGARELSINDPLEQNDRVITTGDGSVYIHFIDDTVLTIGANSEVILDKFVFKATRRK